jgi:uncharacterized delta-60 repeat protein
MSILAIKSGTTAIAGSTVKGSFSYFSASTKDLGPTSLTGFYSGIDAPSGGYTVYQIGGLNGWTARVATDTTDLNLILISAGGTGSTVDQNITWATNTNTVYVNSGTTSAATSTYFYYGGSNFVTKIDSDYTTVNSSFNTGTGFNSLVNKVTTDSNSKLLVGGQFTTFNSSSQNRLVRLNTDGSKDTSLNIGTGFNNTVVSIITDANSKIMVGGSYTQFSGATQGSLIRLNSDGSKDSSFVIGVGFAGSPSVNDMKVDSNGKIYCTGNWGAYSGSTSFRRIIRINTNGSADSTFNVGTGSSSGFNALGTKLVIDSNGKILVGGNFTTYNSQTANRLVRLGLFGTLDPNFSVGTGFDAAVNALTIDSNGKILVGGAFTTFTGSSQVGLIRLNSDGSKDTSFNVGTGISPSSQILSITVDTNGKIICVGNFYTYNGTSTPYNQVILNSDGSFYSAGNSSAALSTIYSSISSTS